LGSLDMTHVSVFVSEANLLEALCVI
jgi:hypothetical protein